MIYLLDVERFCVLGLCLLYYITCLDKATHPRSATALPWLDHPIMVCWRSQEAKTTVKGGVCVIWLTGSVRVRANRVTRLSASRG